MFKKAIMSAAIASTVALSGCLDSGEPNTSNAGAQTDPIVNSSVFPLFSPAESVIPIPGDILIDQTAGDGSYAIPDVLPPVTTALNGLSGASTIAPIDIPLSGLVDEATVIGPDDPANQNVFLLALAYASEEPLQGLGIGEIPTISPAQPSFVVETLTLDGATTLRINPTAVLDAKTRYLVVVRNTILDLSGAPITQSPGLGGYATLTKTDEESPLVGALAGLQGARDLINGFEPLAIAAIPTINSDADLAYTYTFTTSDDEKVLAYINDPAKWISDSVLGQVRVGAAAAALEAGAADYATIKATVDAVVNSWAPTSLDPEGNLDPILGACPTGLDGFDCAGISLYGAAEAGALTGGDPINFPDPEASTITMLGAPVDVITLNPALGTPAGGPIPPGTVFAQQGTMTIPYYGGIPSTYPNQPTAGEAAAGTGLPLKYTNWVADDALAAQIGTALGIAIPQADPSVSTVNNYVFPFPKKTGDVSIPVLALFPDAGALGGAPVKPMIWGHGLGGDRTNVLGFGSLLVAQGALLAASGDISALNAVIAIDEPIHGITDANNPLNALNLGTIERHFGYQDGGVGPENPPSLIEEGGSGSMFINVESFLTARDNNRQHVLDLLTLRQSIDSGTIGGNTLGAEFFYSGHSLGTINSQAMVAIANANTAATDPTFAADDFTAAVFLTPGAGVARFLENSPQFGPTIISGLSLAGVTPDTGGYQTYLNVLQAALDTFDAINFADSFAAPATPLAKVHYFEAVNDTVIPVKIDEIARTLRAPAGTFGNIVDLEGSVSYLSGAEPLLTISNATPIEAAGTFPDPVTVVRYNACAADHGTPVIPGSDAFAENLTHVISIISSNGAAVVATPDLTEKDLVETADPLPLIDLEPDCS